MADLTQPENSDRKLLAVMNIAGFFVICVVSFAFMHFDPHVESWEAGIIGAVLGYWAANVASSLGWYFGGAAQNAPPKTSVTTTTKTPEIQQTTTTGPAQPLPPEEPKL